MEAPPKGLLVALLLGLAALAPVPLHAQAEPTPAAIRAELATLLRAQRDAWNRGDLDAFMQPYWRSDSLRFVGKSGVTYGYDSLVARYSRTYGLGAEMGQLDFTLLHIDVLSADAALMVGRWQLQHRGRALGGYFTLLWRRLDRRWLIVLDHTS